MALMVRCAALIVLTLGLLNGPANAASLDEAKAAGLVGERVNGYVGVVDGSAPGDVKALVEQINAERKSKYAEIAQQRGTSVDAVAQIAGEKLVGRTPAGQYVMGADGKWQQK